LAAHLEKMEGQEEHSALWDTVTIAVRSFVYCTFRQCKYLMHNMQIIAQT